MRGQQQIIERFIVADNNTVLANVALSGQKLYDLANGKVNLTDGQLGIVYHNPENLATKDEFTAAGVTTSTAKEVKIQIVQGTNESQLLASSLVSPQGGFETRMIRSGIIDLAKPVFFMREGQLAENACLSTALVTGVSAQNELEYRLKVWVSGREINKFNSEESTDMPVIAYTTPNYTALSVTNSLDHLYKNLAWQAFAQSIVYKNPISNNRGTQPYTVLGLSLAGAATNPTFGGTTYTLPTVAQVLSGAVTSIVVAVQRTSVSGNRFVEFTMPVTVELQEALTDAVAAGVGIVAGTKFTILDLTQAGNSATVNATNGLFWVGLKSADYLVTDEAHDQKITRIKVTADPLKDLHTLAPTLVQTSEWFEGQGSGKVLKVRYNRRAVGDQYNMQYWGSQFDFIPKYSKIDPNKFYTVYCIESELDESEFNGHNYTDSIIVKTWILVEASAPAVGATGTTQANPKAGLIAYLKPLLDSVQRKIDYTAATFA